MMVLLGRAGAIESPNDVAVKSLDYGFNESSNRTPSFFAVL